MVSLSEKVVLVPLAVETGAVKEGFRFLPSRRNAIKACAIKACTTKVGVVEADSGSCCQGG